MKTDEYALVTTTTATQAESEKIARALLAKKLAACVQITQVKSFFSWKNALNVETEELLLIKCKCADYAEIEECIQENHPYETPEIVQLPISGGSPAYLEWISQVTR